MFELDVYDTLAEVLSATGDYPVLNLGGGLGVRLHARPATRRPSTSSPRRCSSALPSGVKVLCEPGRSLVANAGVTLYTVGTVKEIPACAPTSRSTAACPTTCARCSTTRVYEAEIADRFGGDDALPARRACTASPATSWSRDVALADPAPGDVLVTPATGAYGHAMANNYNGVPRPPVIFCRDGDARVVVRRETYEDLSAA